MLRLRSRRLLDQALNVGLLNLQVASKVVVARPVTQTAHTQLVSIVSEPKRHPLRLRLAEVILLLRLLTEDVPDLIQVRVNILQTHTDIHPLLILDIPVLRQVVHMVRVILAQSLRQRLLIDDSVR